MILIQAIPNAMVTDVAARNVAGQLRKTRESVAGMKSHHLIRRSMRFVRSVRQDPKPQVRLHWMSRPSALVRCRPVSL